jgi:NAD(P)H-quinone oxidoreductase subunit 5
MDTPQSVQWLGMLAPLALMATAAAGSMLPQTSTLGRWRFFQTLSSCALILVALTLFSGGGRLHWNGVLAASTFSLSLATLVQLLGTVIGTFSAQYLQGEPKQSTYVAALAGVLASVQLLLLADHWIVLIAAWAGVGLALQPLLCFYEDRPFARLAAHKKRIADRLADLFLLLAAALAWNEVGSGSLSALWMHLEQHAISMNLQLSALALVLAVILRTALLPVHGWLIQVMEAPTPVSALLHAGVVNLGGFLMIRFAPLLEQASLARGILMVFGLSTAVLAGMVMLTRISIKVRLAWSTVAQMGFMLLECSLGLYTLAALHLIGHSLYKAHAFLSASTVVRQTRLRALHQSDAPSLISLALSPILSIALVLFMAPLAAKAAWPWWWSAVLGLAWAPLIWLPSNLSGAATRTRQLLVGGLLVSGLTLAAIAAHWLPFGLQDAPNDALGLIALGGMALLYLGLALLQRTPKTLAGFRRWSYAGFYLDEAYTRLSLWIWPSGWAPKVQHKST